MSTTSSPFTWAQLASLPKKAPQQLSESETTGGPKRVVTVNKSVVTSAEPLGVTDTLKGGKGENYAESARGRGSHGKGSGRGNRRWKGNEQGREHDDNYVRGRGRGRAVPPPTSDTRMSARDTPTNEAVHVVSSGHGISTSRKKDSTTNLTIPETARGATTTVGFVPSAAAIVAVGRTAIRAEGPPPCHSSAPSPFSFDRDGPHGVSLRDKSVHSLPSSGEGSREVSRLSSFFGRAEQNARGKSSSASCNQNSNNNDDLASVASSFSRRGSVISSADVSSVLPSHIRGGGVMPFSGTPTTPLTNDDKTMLKAELLRFLERAMEQCKARNTLFLTSLGSRRGADEEEETRSRVHSSSAEFTSSVLVADGKKKAEGEGEEEEEEKRCGDRKGFGKFGFSARTAESKTHASSSPSSSSTSLPSLLSDELRLLKVYRDLLVHGGTHWAHLVESNENELQSNKGVDKKESPSNHQTLEDQSPPPHKVIASILSAYYPHTWNLLDPSTKASLKAKASTFGPNDVRISQTKATGRYVTYCLALLRGRGRKGGGAAAAASKQEEEGDEGEDEEKSVKRVRDGRPEDEEEEECGGPKTVYQCVRIHAVGDGISTAVRVANILKEKIDADTVKKKRQLFLMRKEEGSKMTMGQDRGDQEPLPPAAATRDTEGRGDEGESGRWTHKGREKEKDAARGESQVVATQQQQDTTMFYYLDQETLIDTVWCSTVYVQKPTCSRETTTQVPPTKMHSFCHRGEGGGGGGAATEKRNDPPPSDNDGNDDGNKNPFRLPKTIAEAQSRLLSFLPERIVARHQTPTITITLTKRPL